MATLSLPPLPFIDHPVPYELSYQILQLMGMEVKVTGQHHIPHGTPLIIISNHRSPFDPLVLMTGLRQNIAFACHQYMGNVPLLRDLVKQFGAFPLETPRQFFRQGLQHLRQRQAIGIFPEGAKPMVELQDPHMVNPFQRGFAHLALRVPVEPLALLPVALVSEEVGFESLIPLKLLGLFAPSEPLFQQDGGHPVVIYRHIEVRIGEPIWVTEGDRIKYRGRLGNSVAQSLTDQCWLTVNNLLQK